MWTYEKNKLENAIISGSINLIDRLCALKKFSYRPELLACEAPLKALQHMVEKHNCRPEMLWWGAAESNRIDVLHWLLEKHFDEERVNFCSHIARARKNKKVCELLNAHGS